MNNEKITLEEAINIIEESAEYYGIDSLSMVEMLVNNYKTLDPKGRLVLETFMDGVKRFDK